MKNNLLVFLIATLLISCKQDLRYAQNSAEIDAVKAIIKAYNTKNWRTSATYYADSSKTIFNRNTMASKDVPNYHKQNDLNYEKRGFIKEGQEYEMVIDDDGKTWVNFWGTWNGTLKATGKTYTIPVHLTSRFINGKIVEEFGYWDPSEVAFALKEIEKTNSLPDQNKVILGHIKTFIEKFLNEQNSTVLNEIIGANYARYFNDEKVASGQKELEANIAPYFKGFSDFKVNLLNTSPIHENTIFVHWKVTGTHDGEFLGIAPTGKKVMFNGLSRLHFDNDGKMDTEYLYFDQLNLMQQLGKSFN